MVKKHDYEIAKINGLKTVLLPLKDKRTFYAEIIFNAGAWYEPKKSRGVMHFLEHMLFNGTKDFPEKILMEEYLEEHGLGSNAYTSAKYLGVETWGPSYSLKEGIRVLSQLVAHPLLPDKEIERELKVVTQEYENKWDRPMNRFGREVGKNLFGKDHLYTREALGEPKKLKNITSKQLHEYKNEYLNADNGILFIVGNFKTGDAKKYVKEYFSLNKGKNFKPTLKFEPTKVDQYNFIYKDTLNLNYFGYDWIFAGDDKLSLKDRYIARVASYILGGSIRSLLSRELRLKLGLVYSVGSSYGIYPDISYFSVHSEVTQQNYELTTSAIDKIITNLHENGIEDGFFDRSKGYQMAQLEIAMDTARDIANMIKGDLLTFGKIYHPTERLETFKSITKSDVEKFYRELFAQQKIVSLMTKKEDEK